LSFSYKIVTSFVFCSRYLVNILYWSLLLLLLHFFLLLLHLYTPIHINPNSLRFPCDYFEQRQITYKVHTRHIYTHIYESIETHTTLSLSSHTCAYIDRFVLKKKLRRRRRRRRRRQINETHCHYHYPLLFFGIFWNKVKKNKLVNTTNIQSKSVS